MKFLTHPLMQKIFINLLKMKWIYVDRQDSNFPIISNKHRTKGDPKQSPTTFFTDRSKWDLWVVYQCLGTSGLIGFDDFKNHRMVCVGEHVGTEQYVALAMGNEPADFFLLVSKEMDVGKKPQLQFIQYCTEEELTRKFPQIPRL